jgi:cupin fold WbuC family metalloprotein
VVHSLRLAELQLESYANPMAGPKLALDHPEGDLVVLTQTALERAIAESRFAPRKRIIQPFHRTLDDALHRMFNAIQPGSYARPHRHLEPPKAEAWIVLRGRLLFVSFLDDGAIDQAMVLGAGSEQFGVDLVAGRYHTIAALERDTVIYEVKSGPYTRATDKEFAPWAPAEESPEAGAYLRKLLELAKT